MIRPDASHSKDTQKNDDEEEFTRRRVKYQQICQKGEIKMTRTSGPVYYYSPAKLAVCLAPKVGCTFWKRIFHFLHNETHAKGVTSPYQIDRFYVHFGLKKKTKHTGYATKKLMFDNYTKVMFARDPWLRVWSAYVDKFVLPDFWLNHGFQILKRRKQARNLTLQQIKQNSCPDDISFEEFMDYAMNVNDDGHWRPVHRLCNPCEFQPQYLGKVETFSRDSAQILGHVGLPNLLHGHESHTRFAEDEIRMLTKYQYKIYSTRKGVHKCLNHSGMARRELDSISDSDAAALKATELLLKYHRVNPPLTSEQMTQRRRHFMVQHYRNVSAALLEKLVSKFKNDFALFGYESHPKDIFTS